MNRLRHSFSGYRRSMQMSRALLYAFIEGHSAERYVYSQILDSECQRLKIPYQIVSIEEISGCTGGKRDMLRFFDYLQAKSSLTDTFKGGVTVSIFFLDKDVDDILGAKRMSKHIIYTETYELENYIFIYGDLCKAAASAVSLDIGSVRRGIGDYAKWRDRAATKWKDWVKLCLFSRMCKISSMSNYKRGTSPINNGAYGRLKKKEYKCHLSDLRSRLGLHSTQFSSKFRQVSSLVDKIYSKGHYDIVFKGKWYACFLIEDIRKIAQRRRCTQVSREMLINNLTQTLDFDNSWANHFKTPLRRLIAKSRP